MRNFQATVFSLHGSGIAPFQSSKSHTILYAEAELQNFKSQYIPCAEAELQAKNIPCVEAELQNFKSHSSLYVEYLWFLIQESEGPCVKAILGVLFSTVPS